MQTFLEKEFPQMRRYANVSETSFAPDGYAGQFCGISICLPKDVMSGDQIFGDTAYDHSTFFHESLHGVAMSHEGGFLGLMLTELTTTVFVPDEPGYLVYGRSHQWVAETAGKITDYYNQVPRFPLPRPDISAQSYYKYRSEFLQ